MIMKRKYPLQVDAIKAARELYNNEDAIKAQLELSDEYTSEFYDKYKKLVVRVKFYRKDDQTYKEFTRYNTHDHSVVTRRKENTDIPYSSYADNESVREAELLYCDPSEILSKIERKEGISNFKYTKPFHKQDDDITAQVTFYEKTNNNKTNLYKMLRVCKTFKEQPYPNKPNYYQLHSKIVFTYIEKISKPNRHQI